MELKLHQECLGRLWSWERSLWICRVHSTADCTWAALSKRPNWINMIWGCRIVQSTAADLAGILPWGANRCLANRHIVSGTACEGNFWREKPFFALHTKEASQILHKTVCLNLLCKCYTFLVGWPLTCTEEFWTAGSRIFFGKRRKRMLLAQISVSEHFPAAWCEVFLSRFEMKGVFPFLSVFPISSFPGPRRRQNTHDF